LVTPSMVGLGCQGEASPGNLWGPRLRCTHDTRMRNEAVVNTALAPSSPLTAADRCDRCGAQAYLRVELQSGGELLFCAHHAREHGNKLKQIAVNLVDETDKLTDTNSATSSSDAEG
jgi:hypothetical protein